LVGWSVTYEAHLFKRKDDIPSSHVDFLIFHAVVFIKSASVTFGRYNELCYGELILLGLY